MKKEDVKVGMKVVPHDKTGSGYTFDRWIKSGWSHDFRENGFTVVRNIDGNEVWAGDGGSGNTIFHASDFEPATIEVGDTVRVMKIRDGKNIIGKSGIVIARDTWRGHEEACVEFSDDISGHAGAALGAHGKGGHCWNFSLDELDLVRKAKKEPEKPADRRPTVGDWVEVVAWGEWHKRRTLPAVPVGSIVKIEADDHDDHPFRFHVGEYYYAAAADEVKLTTAPVKPEAEKPREFKVGDVVKWTRCDGKIEHKKISKVDTGDKFPYAIGGHWFDGNCKSCIGDGGFVIDTAEPAAVLRSDAEAAVRRAYCEGFSDGQKHIVGCVVEPKPTQKALAAFWSDK